jgi:hypothetical protein
MASKPNDIKIIDCWFNDMTVFDEKYVEVQGVP